MKKRLLSFVVCTCIILCCFTITALAKNSDSIVILYENDVHCVVEGYSKLASMKNELSAEYEYVGVVSSGDFVQGGSLGAASEGEYIVGLMNIVGYDAIGLGNHEFDYCIPRLEELFEISKTKYISCNFTKIGEEKSYFEPYTIVSYGDIDIAYIGIITPETVTSARPSQFRNEKGELIYTFNESRLPEVIQDSIDKAKQEGAEYIIALSHMGYDESGVYYDVTDIIENTDGLDVVLDGHSHTVIEEMIVTDKSGDEVLLTSTGTGFQHIGKLTIADGKFDTELIKTETYTKTDANVDAYIAEIKESYAEIGNRIIAESKIDLITNDENGNRLVRKAETNLGNFCSDALRILMNSDVAFVNGGGIRAPIKAGNVTFNDLLSVYPFNNTIVSAEVTGQVLLDMLEMCMNPYPEECGAFPHMSGMKFSVDKSIPSSLKVDEQGFFVGVDGEYRVYNVKVLNKENGKYEDLELDKKYVIAASNYYILDFGSGLSMFKDATIVKNEGTLDVETLEMYITDNLNGVIGEEYQNTDKRITFTDGKANEGVDRATVVTALWEIAGSPIVNYAMSFEDVEEENSFAEAIRWAASAGIVNGYTDKMFAPYDEITREQLASIMWRHAKYENKDVSIGESTNILSYEDISLVSEYAIPALQWSCGSGILSGYEDGTLAPKKAISQNQFDSILASYSLD